MRVAVLGGTGLLGHYLVRELISCGDDTVVLSRHSETRIDLRVAGSATVALRECQPDVVAYLAALTNLEECERHPDIAFAVHVRGAQEVAAWCNTADRPLVYVSTDSVFDGIKGNYTEDDFPNPVNAYASSKVAGEQVVLSAGGCVIRTNFLGAGRGGLLQWLAVALESGQTVTGYEDIRFSPLAAVDLAVAMRRILCAPGNEIYHVGGFATITKYDLACYVQTQLHKGHVNAGPAPQERLRRPLDTSLNSAKARSALGAYDQGWHVGVRNDLAAIREAVS